MKTTQRFRAGTPAQRGMRGAVAIGTVCAGLLAADGAAAQARAPQPMQVAMAPVPGAAAGGVAAVPVPIRGPNCSGEIHRESNVTVAVGKSELIPLAEPVRNRSVGNPVIAQASLVAARTLYVVGLNVGTTNMILEGRSGNCQIIDVTVNIDPAGVQQSIAQLLPDERGIRVSTAAGNLVLSGRVSSAPAAQQAMEIARAFAAAEPTQQSQSAQGSMGNGTTVSQQSSSTSKQSDVLNMMTVDAPQQVMLEVKVAEVSKTLIKQLGSAVNIQGGFGSWSGQLVSNLLAGVTSGFIGNKANNKPFSFAVDAQKTDDLVKILAEPNLVTASGQEASFLSGGKIFIPVPQSSGSGYTSVTLQEEEFGVGLKFTPTVLANGHISLKVAPEVSELSPTGVTLSASNVNGVSIIPLITTRRASTVVQMADGESFAIGGLIQSNVTGALKAIPGLGEVPVLGALMRSTSFQQDMTELVFIVTPHLVKPLRTANLPLPTDSFSQPSDVDVYATGNMEGRHPKVVPAPNAPVAPAAPNAPATPAGGPAPAPLQAAPLSQQPARPAATGALPPPSSAAPAQQQPRPVEPVATTVPVETPQPVATAIPPEAPQPVADDEASARAARIERNAARLAGTPLEGIPTASTAQDAANQASTH